MSSKPTTHMSSSSAIKQEQKYFYDQVIEDIKRIEAQIIAVRRKASEQIEKLETELEHLRMDRDDKKRVFGF